MEPSTTLSYDFFDITHLVIECCAAGIAPLLIHGCDDRPLVSLGPVSLGSVESGVPVVAAHGIDASVQQSDADIAAAEVHGGHVMPRSRAQVKLAHAVEVLHPVKAAEAVDRAVVDCGAMVRTRLQIVLHVDPDVRAEVVGLDAVARIPATPATNRQEYSRREAGASHGIADSIQRRDFLPHQILYVQGVVHHLQALSAFSHHLICFDSHINELFIYQGQPDLQRNDRMNVLRWSPDACCHTVMLTGSHIGLINLSCFDDFVCKLI